MGIEQILIPILGGVAKGVGTGLEEKRRNEREAERQRNEKMAAKFIKDPELFEEPTFRKWAQNYWGKDEAHAMYSAARLQKIQQQYDVGQHRLGIMESGPIPADQIPPEPVFNDPEPAGSQGAIAGIISKFLPGVGAGMNALGLGGSNAKAQMIPQPSTGPPSGPQSYGAPSSQAGWQTAAAAPQVPPAALSGMDQRIGVPAVSKVPTTKIVSMPGGRMSISGITTGGAPGGGRKVTRVNQLAEGVTESIDKDGNSRFTFKKTDPNLSTAIGVSQQLRRLEGGSGDLDDPVEFKLIWDGARDIEAVQAYDKVNFQTQAESDPDILERRARIERRLTGAKVEATKNAEFEFESRPDVQQLRQEQKFKDAQKTSQGQTAAENMPVVDENGNPLAIDAQGNPLTKNQLDVLKAGAIDRQKELSTTVDTVTQKSIDGKLSMLAMVDRIWQNFDPKFLGVIQGTGKALKWREIGGLASGPESVMRQTMKTLSNIKIQDLTGAGVTTLDAERILAELPSPQDSPDVFVAKLANFQTLLAEAIDRQKTGATQPRGDLAPSTLPAPARSTALTDKVLAPRKVDKLTINPKTGKPWNYRGVSSGGENNPIVNAPSPPQKTYEVNQSSVATPALRKAMKKQIDQMVKDGFLDPDAEMIVIPDSAAIPGERIQ